MNILTALIALIAALVELLFPMKEEDVTTVYERVKHFVKKYDKALGVDGLPMDGGEKYDRALRDIQSAGIDEGLPLRDVNLLIEMAVAQISREAE